VCDLEEVVFIRVGAMFLFFNPLRTISAACLPSLISTTVKEGIVIPFLFDSLIGRFDSAGFSKS
jgi:hypothetical protein